MKASEIAGLPIQLGAAVRHRRLFHPAGVLASGSIERIVASGEGLPIQSGPIVGRVSKALGVPGSLPDVAGLAWRMPPAVTGSTAWDVLLATAGLGSASALPNRLLLHPVTSWSDTLYSSLMPVRYERQLWWIRARLTTGLTAPGLSLDTVVDGLGRGGLAFDVEQARGTGPFGQLARLSLSEIIPAAEHSKDDIAFDPARNTAAGVELWPDWLRGVRRQAYRSSREGHDAEGANP
ncbi:MAG: phosphodiesterase [Mycobacterium sp.]